MDLVHYPSFENYFGQKDKEIFNKDFSHQMWERVSSGKLSNRVILSGFRLFSFINTHIRCHVDKLQNHFWGVNKKYWSPFTRVCLDETIVRFTGRCSHRQYIRGKPDSTGLKYFILTDESLFTYRSFLYHSYHPGVYNIVKDFTNFLQPGHIFCADRYYGGLNSAQILDRTGHRFIFCCPQNRPKSLFNELRKRFIKFIKKEKKKKIQKVGTPAIQEHFW